MIFAAIADHNFIVIRSAFTRVGGVTTYSALERQRFPEHSLGIASGCKAHKESNRVSATSVKKGSFVGRQVS